MNCEWYTYKHKPNNKGNGTMIKRKSNIILATLLVALAGLLFVAAPAAVHALENTGESDDTLQTSSDGQTSDDTKDTSDNQSTTSRRDALLQAEQKQKDTRKKLCENRSTTLKNIMLRVSNRGTKLVDLFSKISTRVETFYSEKGYDVPNYDNLVATIATKKAAALTAVDALKTAANEFTCDQSDPKASIVAFKTALKAERMALKEFRTSVKDLIVAVKAKYTAGQEGGQQ